MQLLYADETGDNGLPESPTEEFKNSHYFARVGVILHDKKWHSINSKVNAFRKKYHIPYGVEIHATEVLSGKTQQTYKIDGKRKKRKNVNWFGQQFKTREERKQLLGEFLDITFQSGFLKIIAIVIDKRKIDLTQAKSHIARNPKMKSLELLSERYNFFIKTSIDRNGLLIMDSVGTVDDATHHAFQKSLYKDSKYLQSYHFIESLLFAPSEQSNFLQIADVCAYSVKRSLVDNDDFLYDKIKDYLFQVKGKTEGRGYKRWPT